MAFNFQDDKLREAFVQMDSDVVLNKSGLISSGLFEVVGPAQCPGGTRINFKARYSVTDNTKATTVGSAMPDPNDELFVDFYFTKDYKDSTVRTSDIVKSQTVVNYSGQDGEFEGSPDQAMIRKNLVELVQAFDAQMISDAEAHIDSASAFSDASLVRATYGMAAYEETTATTLTLAHMDGAIDALLGPSYGPNVGNSTADLAWLMPRNQFRRLANLVGGAQYREVAAALDSGAPIDGSIAARMPTYEGIPIRVVNGMTTTVILLVHRPSIKIWNHMATQIKDKTQGLLGEGALYHILAGMNLTVENPMDHAKLSAKTA